MLTENRGGKLNRFNDPDVNRKTKAENKKQIYQQMEKTPSEHAKKFFEMEGYQHIKGKGKKNNEN